MCADISMCQNTDCHKHNHCYRFTALPLEYWQSYAEFNPDSEGNCKYYIEDHSKSQHKRLEVQTK